MSEAYKCDICGEYIIGRPFSNLEYKRDLKSDINDTPEEKHFELCITCSRKLFKYLKNKKDSLSEKELFCRFCGVETTLFNTVICQECLSLYRKIRDNSGTVIKMIKEIKEIYDETT
jgi:hypothetical protein